MRRENSGGNRAKIAPLEKALVDGEVKDPARQS